MLNIIFLLLIGIAFLYVGAELLIIFAARLALSLGMTPLVVGLTVVAFSTSTPELASTLVAQIHGAHSNIAMGTIVGSNIANIGFILGLITLIKPLEIKKQIKTFEAPLAVGLTLLLWVFMLRGTITRAMGILFLVGIILYTYKHVTSTKDKSDNVNQEAQKISASKRSLYFLFILVGVFILCAGGVFLVRGSVMLAKILGISDRVIGLTVVALGTSLPEFAASLVAILRKLGDVAIGNILGSNIFNILFILGVVAVVKPIQFSPKFLNQDVPILLGFSALLWLLVSYQKKLGRLSGLLLIICYGGYLIFVA